MPKSKDIIVSFEEPTRLKEVFEQHGAILLRNCMQIDRIESLNEAISKLIRARANSLNISEINEKDDNDSALSKLFKHDSSIVQELILAIRECVEFHNLIFDPNVDNVIKMVVQAGLRQFAGDFCMMRIDTNYSRERLFDWHYDSAYTSMPKSAVTCWIPLTKVTEDMGNLKIIPGSHKKHWKIKFIESIAKKKFSGPKRVELVDVDVNDLEQQAIEVPDMSKGDLLLIHGWLLHRSGINVSNKARWICNPRFCDLMDNSLVNHGWRLSRVGNPWVFREYYPELVVDS